MNFNERMIDPKSPDRRPRRAAYALPTFFTAGNIFLGYLSVIQSFQGAMLASGTGVGAEPHFEMAAKCIGLAVFLDGLDGRIARMTNTTSDFGREMDSLADAISFGIAPAVLAFAWGIQFLDPTFDAAIREHVVQVGYFISFLFLLCGSARLARFNIQKNPVPKNPGRPDRKYFVEEQDIRVGMDGDGESKAHLHSVRVVAEGRVDLVREVRGIECEADDGIEALPDRPHGHPQDRPV